MDQNNTHHSNYVSICTCHTGEMGKEICPTHHPIPGVITTTTRFMDKNVEIPADFSYRAQALLDTIGDEFNKLYQRLDFMTKEMESVRNSLKDIQNQIREYGSE